MVVAVVVGVVVVAADGDRGHQENITRSSLALARGSNDDYDTVLECRPAILASTRAA